MQKHLEVVAEVPGHNMDFLSFRRDNQVIDGVIIPDAYIIRVAAGMAVVISKDKVYILKETEEHNE
jgi:hypothetical protein